MRSRLPTWRKSSMPSVSSACVRPKSCDELDLRRIRGNDLNDCAEISPSRPGARDVVGDGNGVENVEHGHLGKAVTNAGESAAAPMIDTLLPV